MNEDRDVCIERLLRQGIPKTRIAERLGIARNTVDRVAALVGLPAKRRGVDRHDWAAVREYYDAGTTAADCMRRFGFSASTWNAAIARGDVLPRRRASLQLATGERRSQVAVLLDAGHGVGEIARQLGISKPTVCYHARKLGVPPDGRFSKRIDWESVQVAHDSGISVRECARTFGFHLGSWHQAVKRGAVRPRDHRIPLEQLLVIGRPTARTHLKSRLVAAGLKQNRCERCGISRWQGEPLNMQLHHRNGDGLDNRLENLQFLCANCHSLTDTWGGRNHRRRRSSSQAA